MDTSRIFAAIEISDEVRRIVGDRLSELHQQDTENVVRWERPEKMHITLKFLPEAFPHEVKALDAILVETAGLFQAFTAQVEGVGAFPDEIKSRVLWFGLGEGEETIAAIAADIEKRCRQHRLPVERRRFYPHLTAGRIRDPRKARPITQRFLETGFEAVPFDVTRLVLIESKLQPGGSVYSVLSSHDLTAAGE